MRRVSADDDRPILPTSGDEVAVDSVGAGVGELVLLCSGSSARHVFSGPRPSILPSWALLTHFHAKGCLWLSIPEPAMPAVHHSLPASGSADASARRSLRHLDELNAMLSLCVCAVAEEEQRTLLEALQQHIFGSARSSPATANSHHRVSAISAAKRLPCWSRPSIARWPACRRCTSLYCPDAVKPPAVCFGPHRCQTGGAPAGRAGGRGYYPSDTAALSEPLI